MMDPHFVPLPPHIGDFHPPDHIPGPKMSWRVVDLMTMEETEFDATGGHFQSFVGHRYLIVVRAGGPLDVTKMTLDGAGEFQAATNPDASGGELQAPHPLPASVPHHEFNDRNGAIPPQELIVTMGPDSESFDYFELSCGIQDFDGSGEHEYFAFDGLMTFTATGENTVFSSSATLTTSPEPTVPQP